MQLLSKLKYYFFVKLRVLKYQLLSDCKTIGFKPKCVTPVLFSGKGQIEMGKNVQFGYKHSPYFYTHYSYIEARTKTAKIKIGNNVIVNNACSIVALNKISIGDNCTIGTNFSVLDSNFHHLEPEKRHDNNPPSSVVNIGKNVFIGNNVTVLKGVTVGNNSVIGSNAVVFESIPENVVVSGNPAQIIKKL